MGYGVNIHCKCRDQELWLGVGMAFPMVYQETMEDIRSGKYGKEMAKLANETELVTVDAELTPYLCESCGLVEANPCLDLYKPNDIEAARKAVIGNWTAAEPRSNKTVGELGDWPYWTPPSNDEDDFGENEGNYVLLKEYEHMCPECKKLMKKVTDDFENIKCPKCGEKYQTFPGVLWDQNNKERRLAKKRLSSALLFDTNRKTN